MNIRISLFFGFIILGLPLWAGEQPAAFRAALLTTGKDDAAVKPLMVNNRVDWYEPAAKTELLNEMRLYFQTRETAEEGTKSPALSALFSAVVPGAGQAYAKSYWKAAAFAVAEVLLVAGYISYQSRGDAKDREMRALADSRWDEKRYWSKVYKLATDNNDWDGPPLQTDANGLLSQSDVDANIDRLRYWESNGNYYGFTHVLPTTKTQQYYEMIYKYLIQFGVGWQELGNDWNYYDNPSSLNNLTDDVARYKTIRNQSNDFYHTAVTLSWVVLVNHLGSAIDAALTAKNYNQKLHVRLYGQSRYYAGRVMPMYGLQFNW